MDSSRTNTRDHIVEIVNRNLKNAVLETNPFDHWIYNKVLPIKIADDLLNLSINPPEISFYSGKRESNNNTRVFLNKENCNKYSCMQDVVDIFNNPKIILQLSNICGKNLTKGKLRIEYTMDTGSFWLEPHLDIKEKMITFLIYLSNDPNSGEWGTTIYNDDLTFHSKAPYRQNLGLMFMAGKNTWHGVPMQNIQGIRKNLIINYVVSDWKSVHELAPV
jgi:hypothetical protein|tara:strand:- start:341 stop:997 length:657 start_codon:yes stop_codon:yes gene_type:complete